MARRSAPPGSGPSYLSPQYGISNRGSADVDPDESALSRFMREQIFAPEYLQGNQTILVSLAMFVGGVAALRQWGEGLALGL
ncbi:hypothetical protein SCHPADRAFT_861017 [Schizopora paradoxa]|uniref:Uncharacterized protein n=1 Tax=Schizopora paradoxa TaxID=27342 RepID=A0A0H2RB85_9AGAM|nr:hypothetical protein SCHPADRAFT_861017 [Schizopora paradoxa]